MVSNVGEYLTTAALLKWQHGEPLSREDFERILSVIQTRDLTLSSVDQPTFAALQVKLRSIVQQKYLPPQQ